MFKDLTSLEDLEIVVKKNTAVLIYFSHEKCNVCKVLKPKIEELIKSDFPEVQLFYADTIKYPELAAQNRIFAVPTIIIFFDGRETFRKSRNIGLGELEGLLARPYNLIFSE